MRHCFKSQVLRHFRCSYLKANKVSKSEGQGKYWWNMHIISENVLMLLTQIIKSVHIVKTTACKLACFFKTVYVIVT